MLYGRDFIIKPDNHLPNLNNSSIFTVTLNKTDRKIPKYPSLSKAFKPLSYFSSLVAMNAIRYTKSGISKVNIWSRLYCILIITIFLTAIIIIRQRVTWRETKTDLPLTIIAKTFTALQCTELIYDIFVTSFCNSGDFIKIFKMIDEVDGHFNQSKKLFIKRRILSICLVVIVIIVVCCTWLISFNLISTITYFTFLIVLLQGVNCVSYAIIIYVQFLNFNKVLLRKVGRMSPSKEIVFSDDLTTCIIKVSRIFPLINRILIQIFILNAFKIFDI